MTFKLKGKGYYLLLIILLVLVIAPIIYKTKFWETHFNNINTGASDLDIYNLTASTAYANESINLNISVHASNSCHDIRYVNVSYSVDDGSNWVNISNSNNYSEINSTDRIYYFELPPQPIETKIFYKVYAENNDSEVFKNDNNGTNFSIYTGSRKAIIVCSANDFYSSETEDEFNGSPDATFDVDTGNWTATGIFGTVDVDTAEGHTSLGSLRITPNGSGEYDVKVVYHWDNLQKFYSYAFYNFSAWVQLPNSNEINGSGARITLEWLDFNSSVIRSDSSMNLTLPNASWQKISITGMASDLNSSEIKAGGLNLVLEVKGSAETTSVVRFDDLFMSRWILVNYSDPFNPNPNPPPPPGGIDSDGFPAQALQAYYVLKDHGYTDDNILLMLYHQNDSVIDIDAFDGVANDLLNATIDIENNDVNASRLLYELNVSNNNSFASEIMLNDQLIIYLIDHGSNQFNTTKNATFHFEADNSYIHEYQFFDLVSKINCWRLQIMADFCFSGNFINKNSSIGGSLYDLKNTLFISAAANTFSWYWINNGNPDGFAGSWFFHNYWAQLDLNKSVINAYNFAVNWVPANHFKTLGAIQGPQFYAHFGSLKVQNYPWL
ncbi:MAG: C13 family peptidase [Promethearchaeota archaeon]